MKVNTEKHLGRIKIISFCFCQIPYLVQVLTFKNNLESFAVQDMSLFYDSHLSSTPDDIVPNGAHMSILTTI